MSQDTCNHAEKESGTLHSWQGCSCARGEVWTRSVLAWVKVPYALTSISNWTMAAKGWASAQGSLVKNPATLPTSASHTPIACLGEDWCSFSSTSMSLFEFPVLLACKFYKPRNRQIEKGKTTSRKGDKIVLVSGNFYEFLRWFLKNFFSECQVLSFYICLEFWANSGEKNIGNLWDSVPSCCMWCAPPTGSHSISPASSRYLKNCC